MLDVGRVCLKIAGRSAGKYCVIVEVVDKTFVLIDGQIKRKRCNIMHLEPTKDVVEIKKGASHADVVKELEKLKISVTDTKPKTRTESRPMRKRKRQEPQKASEKQPKPSKEKKPVKQEKKKEEKKKEGKKSK